MSFFSIIYSLSQFRETLSRYIVAYIRSLNLYLFLFNLPNSLHVWCDCTSLASFLNGPIAASFCFFRPFQITIQIKIEKIKALMVCFRFDPWTRKMVGTDKSTELLRPQTNIDKFLFVWFVFTYLLLFNPSLLNCMEVRHTV